MIEQWLIGAMALAVVSLFIHVHSLLALTGEAPQLLSLGLFISKCSHNFLEVL